MGFAVTLLNNMGFGDDNIIIDIKKFFCDEFCSNQLIIILVEKFQLLLKPWFSYSNWNYVLKLVSIFSSVKFTIKSE